jgi:hypothetical protein
MRIFLLKYRYQIILIFFGIAWIAFLNELLQIKSQNIIYSDSDNYRESASFFYHSFKVHYFRPLGMALIFGLPYLFGGDDATIYSFSFIINILSWLGIALLLFDFLKKYLSPNKALAFAILFYSILGSAFINFHLLTESIFTFLILLSFYYIDKYYIRKSFYYLSLAIGILFFLILIKPGIKFWVILIVIFFSRAFIKNYYRRSIVFIYLSLGLVVFHCIKMKSEYGNFTVSYIDGVTYYNYLGSQAMCLKDSTIFDQGNNERADYMAGLSFPEQKIVAKNDFIDQLKSNKVNFIKAYFLDIFNNTKAASDCIGICKNIAGKSYFEPVKKAMMIISKYQNRFFTLIGLILALYYFLKSYKKPDVITLISLYILYTIAISGVSSQQGDRFHIVFFPFVIILMGKFYAERYLKILPKQQ